MTDEQVIQLAKEIQGIANQMTKFLTPTLSAAQGWWFVGRLQGLADGLALSIPGAVKNKEEDGHG